MLCAYIMYGEKWELEIIFLGRCHVAASEYLILQSSKRYMPFVGMFGSIIVLFSA